MSNELTMENVHFYREPWESPRGDGTDVYLPEGPAHLTIPLALHLANMVLNGNVPIIAEQQQVGVDRRQVERREPKPRRDHSA